MASSNSTLAPTEKRFFENKSAPAQETLTGTGNQCNEDVRNSESNEDVTALADAPSASGSSESEPRDHPGSNSDTDTSEESGSTSDSTEIIINNKKKKLIDKICGKKCCGAVVWFTSVAVALIILLVIFGGLEAHYINNEARCYANFTCTDVYLVLQKFDCNEKSCIQFSNLEVTGVRADNGGDMAYIYLTECSNIEYSHDQSEDCRVYCGISRDNLKITNFIISNNTQRCTLCTLPIHKNVQPSETQCTQTCQFSVTNELVDLASSTGSGLCVLGKGVSNGAGECQHTQISLNVDLRYAKQDHHLVRKVCIPMIGIVFGTLLSTMIILCCYLCCASACKKNKHPVQMDQAEDSRHTFVPDLKNHS